MAFNKTSLSPTLVENVGTYSGFAIGTVALVGGTSTVTIPQMKQVYWSQATSRTTTNVVNVTADSNNTFTITGSGTETCDWIAFGIPKR